jgi:hypothetical protein
MRPDIIMISPEQRLLRVKQLSQIIEEAERAYIYVDWENLPPRRDNTFFDQYRESHERLIQIK